jgi:hypothetical protein
MKIPTCGALRCANGTLRQGILFPRNLLSPKTPIAA